MEHAMNAGRRGYQRVLLATCTECRTSSDPSWRGWRAYRSDDPELDEPPALAFYCRSCAQREFFPES
jgi:hypothetical protein